MPALHRWDRTSKAQIFIMPPKNTAAHNETAELSDQHIHTVLSESNATSVFFSLAAG